MLRFFKKKHNDSEFLFATKNQKKKTSRESVNFNIKITTTLMVLQVQYFEHNNLHFQSKEINLLAYFVYSV